MFANTLQEKLKPVDQEEEDRKVKAGQQYILRNVALAKQPPPPKQHHISRKRATGRAEREWKWVGEHGIVARGRVSHKM